MRTRLLLIALLALLLPATAGAATPLTRNELQPGGGNVRVPHATRAARVDFRERGRQTLLDVDERTGGVRVMGRLGALLTPEDARSGRTIGLDYVREHQEILGIDGADLASLRPSRRSAGGGVEQVDWLQTYKGIANVDSYLRVNLTATGRIINVQSTLWHDLALPSVEPAVSAREAYARAARGYGAPERGSGELVIYNAATGPRLGWRMRVAVDAGHVFDVVSDAKSGEVQRASNYVRNATATIDRNYPGAPTGGTDEVVNIDAYLNGGATTLNGPFAHTVADPNDDIFEPGDENLGTEINAAGGNFNFALTPQSFGSCALDPCIWRPGFSNSWLSNRPRDAAQLHWFVSNFHDYLASSPINFTAANDNFQGADNVIAQSMDGSTTGGGGLPDSTHVNNANMATYPDGTHGFMQMYLTDILGGQSTGLDASVVYHEYTHGLVGRSIVDASGNAAGDGFQGGALNEGTADWFALDYLNSTTSGGLETDAAGDGDVEVGTYTFGGILRTEPADCAVGSAAAACGGSGSAGPGGYTYGDFGKIVSSPEVHADGEIFTQTMWQLRQALITKHGVATGESHVRRLYAEGLRLTPPHPSFLDLRNGILQADTAAGLGDAAEIWDVFAARGMGYFASTEENDTHPVENFSDVPAPGSPTGTVSGTVTDANTGTPLANVKVGFGGHDSGVGPVLAATTSAGGTYTIANVPEGTYPELRANGQALGYDSARAANFAVATGANTRNFVLRRNLAASAGGATATTNGFNFTSSGCGPAHAIDGTRATGWVADKSASRHLTVQLAAPATVSSVELDPTPGCGLGWRAAAKDFTVQVSPDNFFFTTVGSGSFTLADLSKVKAVALSSTPADTRYVRVITSSTLSNQGDGATFVSLGEVAAYAPVVVPVNPTATTDAADTVSETGATLHGRVNPMGTATDYQFEYGTDTTYGTKVPASPAAAGSGSADVSESQALTGLSPNTTYHFRILALRGGTVLDTGADRMFTTAAVPTVTTDPADGITAAGATLHGKVNPKGTATSYRFQYGPDTGYGQQTSVVSAGSGSVNVAVSQAVAGLAPNTIYHFRLVGLRNGSVVATGTDRMFSTLAGPPAVSTDAATSITFQAATLNGTVNPHGSPTTDVHFEYGLTTGYGSNAPVAGPITGNTPSAVQAAVSGLAPATTYHVRLVASTADGTTNGSDQTFTTPAAPTPDVVTKAATAITGTGATLNASIDPNGFATSYRFQYGTTTGYGQQTTETAAGSGSSPTDVGAPVTGLTAGTIYHFRAVALRSGTVVATGSDLTFTSTPSGSGPVVSTEPASGVTSTAAQLNALVNPNGGATQAHFEYGTSTGYGESTSDAAVGSGTQEVPVSQGLSGLSPSTTYHYRVVAGSVTGADRTFTTPSAGGGGGGGGGDGGGGGGTQPPAQTGTPTPGVTSTPGPTFSPTPTPTVTLRGTARPRGQRRPKASVSCVVGSGVRCTLRFARAAGRRLRATLSGAAETLAGATIRARRGKLVLADLSVRLGTGRYTLRLKVGQGRRAERYKLRLTLR